MDNELEGICKVSGPCLIEVLSWDLPRGTEENHENPHSGERVARPKFEMSISGIRGHAVA
jgi:hypothetical protein